MQGHERVRSASEEILFIPPGVKGEVDAEAEVKAEVKDEAGGQDVEHDEGYFEEADDPMDGVPDLSRFDVELVAEPAPWAVRGGKGEGKGKGRGRGKGKGKGKAGADDGGENLGGRVIVDDDGGSSAACNC